MLLHEIQKETGIKSKTKIINTALAEYLRQLNRKSIKKAFGESHFDLDVKKLRNLELYE